MKTTIAGVLGLLLAIVQAAQAQFDYSTNNGAITITLYTGHASAVTISNFVNCIGSAAFAQSSPASIVIPNGLTNIGSAAFSQSGLLTLTIPNNVTEIGEGAFQSCLFLTNVSVGDGLTSIASNSFRACSRLANVTIGNGVTNIAFQAFIGCTNLTNVTLGTNVSDIDESAFAYTRLYSFAIPNSLITIGGGAFYYCASLTNLIIANHVGSIGVEAFDGCAGLTNVAIGSTVTNIGAYALGYCTNLLAINVDPANSNYSSLAGVLFDRGQSTLIQYPGGLRGSYTIPESVTTVTNCAFEFSTGVTNIAIGASVTNIGFLAFQGIQSLASLTVDPQNQYYSAANGVLFNKDQTVLVDFTPVWDKTYTIPNTVRTIGECAFNYCTLTNITIPDGVTSLGQSVFNYCFDLTNITFPASITNIGFTTFYLTSFLTGVYFMGNVPAAVQPFAQSYSATSYYLPGTTGWSNSFSGQPALLWTLPYPVILDSVNYGGPGFGVQSNAFGFTVSWATNQTVVVQACSDLSNPVWQPLQTNTFTATTNGGWFHFTDPQWTNFPARFYRIVSQ